ncbi:MAG: aldolase/citrate lyase family protein [Candidatus Poribacteria bacterium]|nr:aldolase/citrate lyase family protein [Candidatus Poribacteria bacterium]
MPEKSLKQRIHDGEVLVGGGASVATDPDQLRRILDGATFDFISTDSQHSAFNEERLVTFCKVADEFDMPVQFRIKHTRNAYLIGNYLDLGTTGIEVPQVELESTVDEAVNYFYYPQIGKRSWGGTSRPVASEHSGRVEYAKWWSENGVLWMQIESINAVTNARKLAKPGVDCLSFGPADLSFSIEGYPHHWLKSVDDCARHVAEQLKGTGIAVCLRGVAPENRDRYIDMGITMFL